MSAGSEKVQICCRSGLRLTIHHDQDCCERVRVEDVTGDVEDLIGSPILMAEETSEKDPNARESATWTFYKLATSKGYVTIRWLGESNSYYSEEVSVVLAGFG